MVMRMSRVERKKQEKNQGNYAIIKFISLIAIISMLFAGVMIVDHTSRAMMMSEEPRAFGHEKIDKNLHEIIICGEKLYVDEEQIRDMVLATKAELENMVQVVKREARVLFSELQERWGQIQKN